VISFVGAGPGDAELITVRGLGRLRAADVVVHDRLVAPDLLAEIRGGAEVVDVGKAPGRHCWRQLDINALLVDRGRRAPSVVRLKGGDPAIFGRLAEEIGAVRAAGLAFEVVPGVTAACATASRLGISLTERGVASTLVFATGTDHTGHAAASLDWALLGGSDATLVLYMAVHTLDEVVGRLVAHGRDRFEPAAIVERAATAGERTVRAPLGRLAAAARAAAIASPAIVVTGAVVDAVSAVRAARHTLAGAAG
jgi:uroporphyrin-III C-methyltransferase/uroporphyrinogen III methyltransferase/synthase